MMLRALAIAGLVTLAAAAARADEPVTSPSIVAQTHQPMPADVAALDAALKSNDYATINRIHAAIKSGDEMTLFMNWEQVRSFEGGGFYVTYIYMSDLWGMASSLPADTAEEKDEVAQLKQSAVLVGLFAYELIVLDGVKCSDPTAVSHRMDQLIASPVWRYVGEVPEDLRQRMVGGVINLEKFSTGKRANDNVLCTGGMTQMIAGLAAQAASGKPPQEVPNAPGMIGKTYAVPSVSMPNMFVDQSVWQPKQDKLRAAMPENLASLMKTLTQRAK